MNENYKLPTADKLTVDTHDHARVDEASRALAEALELAYALDPAESPEQVIDQSRVERVSSGNEHTVVRGLAEMANQSFLGDLGGDRLTEAERLAGRIKALGDVSKAVMSMRHEAAEG